MVLRFSSFLMGCLVAQAGAQMRQAPNVATFAVKPDTVIDALFAALVTRGEADSSSVRALRTNALGAMSQRSQARVNGRSVSVARTDLERFVQESTRHYLTDAGGRYVLSALVERTTDGKTRVTVMPTIIAIVPGSQNPLGGRPLRSNGVLETAFLQDLSARLKP